MLVSFDTQAAGSKIVLTDSDGNEIISWQSEKSFSSVVISCPEITEGETYTLKAGTYEAEITMDSLVYGSGGAMGMGAGGPGFGNMGPGSTDAEDAGPGNFAPGPGSSDGQRPENGGGFPQQAGGTSEKA